MDFGQLIAYQVLIEILTAVGIFHAPTPVVLPAHTVAPTQAIQNITPTLTAPTKTPTPTNTPTPTVKPTSTPTPTRIIIQNKAAATPTPLPYKDPPAQVNTNTSSGFVCNCAKTCGNMSSCAEAQFQLNNCGCTARDADHDGTACDAQCQ